MICWLKIDLETDSRFGKQWCESYSHFHMWEWKWRQEKVKTVREVKCQEMGIFINRGGKGQVDY